MRRGVGYVRKSVERKELVCFAEIGSFCCEELFEKLDFLAPGVFFALHYREDCEVNVEKKFKFLVFAYFPEWWDVALPMLEEGFSVPFVEGGEDQVVPFFVGCGVSRLNFGLKLVEGLG